MVTMTVSADGGQRITLPAAAPDLSLYLPLVDHSVPRARTAIGQALKEIGYTQEDHADLIFGAGMVVSELVTNAIKHTSQGSRTLVRLYENDDRPLIEVWDLDVWSLPRMKGPDFVDQSGRGLHLVAHYSAMWGIRHCPPSPSMCHWKCVWALLRKEA